MIVYGYLTIDELKRVLQNETERQASEFEVLDSKKNIAYLALSDQLDGYLKTVQNLCKTIHGYEKGGVICEITIPENLLTERETMVSLEANGNVSEFMLFYVPAEYVKSGWVIEWVSDENLDMTAEKAYEILCEKYKVDPPMDIQNAYSVNFS